MKKNKCRKGIGNCLCLEGHCQFFLNGFNWLYSFLFGDNGFNVFFEKYMILMLIDFVCYGDLVRI